jgi:protein-S-isoprenylcysteine O-methyltransferase Ste14
MCPASDKMCIGFIISVLGLVGIIPFYFLSVEHQKLQRRYGKEKGNRIGEILGIISGWSFFTFWIGIWISPQPRFAISVFQDFLIMIPVINFATPLFNLVACLLLIPPGSWLAINGVKETTLKVAETHRPKIVVTTGVYSMVRHPQYLGGLLAHLGISILLSALYSMLLTPIIIALVYLISRKEEKEILREFGKEYEDYRDKVPMLIPKLKR